MSLELPNGFKNTISRIFYDKEILLYEISENTDDFGEVISEIEETGESFMGNVEFSNLAKIQEDYGLKDSIDIAISTDYDLEVGSIIGYQGVLYRTTKVIPSDSHNLIVGNKWESKSTTLISA